MRTRKAIEEESQDLTGGAKVSEMIIELCILEVLLDIRDLLVDANTFRVSQEK